MHYSIEFDVTTHPDDEYPFPQPRFKFMELVAINNGEMPDSWDVGKVVGMKLQFHRWQIAGTLTSQPYWEYNVKQPDDPSNHWWFEENDLVPESEVARLQAEWDAQVAASHPEPDVDDSLSCGAAYYPNESDYLLAEHPESLKE